MDRTCRHTHSHTNEWVSSRRGHKCTHAFVLLRKMGCDTEPERIIPAYTRLVLGALDVAAMLRGVM